ncbi:hypothetical protein NQZ79_g6022 [Umbelopsis isabellina]|nr:hypothetical protein NQZ79_g6022 [Umbelopsis isabellina]
MPILHSRADASNEDESSYNPSAGNTVGESPTTGAGIGIGVALGVIALFAVCLQVYRRQQRKSRQAWLAGFQTPITYYRRNTVQLEPSKAIAAYDATLSDEITINVGDLVRVHGYYDENWAYGQNDTLGMFPRSCMQASTTISTNTVQPDYRHSKTPSSPDTITSPPTAAIKEEKPLPMAPV